jgi:hypothetical protein
MQTLEIEWRHIDLAGVPCERCHTTGAALPRVVAELRRQCGRGHVRVTYRETRLALDGLDASNSVLINGRPLEHWLGAKTGASPCAGCCQATGAPDTHCRTVKVAGSTFEAVPPELILRAACRAVPCCPPESGCPSP